MLLAFVPLLGYFGIGFIDDFIKLVLKNPKGLKPSLKMLGLIIVSVIFIIPIVLLLVLGPVLINFMVNG